MAKETTKRTPKPKAEEKPAASQMVRIQPRVLGIMLGVTHHEPVAASIDDNGNVVLELLVKPDSPEEKLESDDCAVVGTLVTYRGKDRFAKVILGPTPSDY